jgi:hypothetical protein
VSSTYETELRRNIPSPRTPDEDDLASLNYRTCVALLASQPIGRVVCPTTELPTDPLVQLVCGVGKLFVVTVSPLMANELAGAVVAVLVEDRASPHPGWEVLVIGPCRLVDYESRCAKRVLMPQERDLAVEMVSPAINGRVFVSKHAPDRQSSVPTGTD